MPELLGAVDSLTRAHTVPVSAEEMAPREGRAFARGLLLVFHMCDVDDPALIRDLASIVELSCHIPWSLNETSLY